MWRTFIGAACLLTGASTIALAQKSYALGVAGGVAVPVGKLSDTKKAGASALAVLAIGVSDLPVGVRFDAFYNNLPRRSDLSSPQSGGAAVPNVDMRVAGAVANLVFAFPGSNSKAYMLAGAGLYNAKLDAAGAKSQNNLGFDGGLGATFGSGPVAIFLEARYNSISRTTANGGVYHFVPITLGLLF
jgi:hypothetical protein